MDINVLIRGQSNADLLGLLGSQDIVDEVQLLLGFDGVHDRVVSVGGSSGPVDARTTYPGTAFLPTTVTPLASWVDPAAQGWRAGWTNDVWERGLLNAVGALGAAQKAAPTAIVWLQNEFDGIAQSLDPGEWESAVRFEAAQVRAALGQEAASTPYLFVDAVPFAAANDASTQAIKQGMAALAADPSFNAVIAAHASDLDMNHDAASDGSHPYGGPHMSGADAAIVADRVARSIADQFAAYAKPGSPIALAGGRVDALGPQVVAAQTVAGNPDGLLLTVSLDRANTLAQLGTAAASGLGWSVRSANGTLISAVAATRVDATHLLLSFGAALPPHAADRLFYAYGTQRLAVPGGAGEQQAIYDDQGLPIWTGAGGVVISRAAQQTVHAGAAATQVDASGHDTLVYGGAGALTVLSTGSVSTVIGGAGQVTAAGLDGSLVVRGGAGGGLYVGGSGGGNSIETGAGQATVMGGGAGDVVFVDNAKDNQVFAGAGDETISANGASGNNILVGGAGQDLLLGGAGHDALFAGAGAGATTLVGGAGHTILVGAGGDELVAGADSAIFANSGDTVIGGAGTALVAMNGTGGLLLAGSGKATLFDGTGGNAVVGGSGSLDVWACGGNDTLVAGSGTTHFIGGSGAGNLIAFVSGQSSGTDLIVNFRQGTDHLRLSGYGDDAAANAIASATSTRGCSLFALAGGPEITVMGAAHLQASDFV